MPRAVLFLLVLVASAFAPAPLQERVKGVRQLVLEVQVDPERARAVGWGAADDAGVVALAAKVVKRRLVAMGREVAVELVSGEERFRLSLPSVDPRDPERLRGLVHSLGALEFLFVAEQEAEREAPRLAAWRRVNPEAPLEELNHLAPDDGGPPEGFAWFETVYHSETGEPTAGPPYLLRLPAEPADHVGAADLARTHLVTDPTGFPAIGFELRPGRVDDFARLTGSHLNRRMAIVIAGRVRSVPTLNSRLGAGGVIEGRFGKDEIERLTREIAAGAGPLRVLEPR
ncbi:MAG TPA: hypothetical protein VF530_00870 [Planctomycetota bacterium]